MNLVSKTFKVNATELPVELQNRNVAESIEEVVLYLEERYEADFVQFYRRDYEHNGTPVTDAFFLMRKYDTLDTMLAEDDGEEGEVPTEVIDILDAYKNTQKELGELSEELKALKENMERLKEELSELKNPPAANIPEAPSPKTAPAKKGKASASKKSAK